MIEVTTKLYDAEEVEQYTEFLRGIVKERLRSIPEGTPLADGITSGTPSANIAEALAAVDPRQLKLPLAKQETAAGVTTVTAAVTTAPVTEQQVVEALRKFVNENGIAEARAILSAAGANRVADLAADKYPEVYAKLTA